MPLFGNDGRRDAIAQAMMRNGAAGPASPQFGDPNAAAARMAALQRQRMAGRANAAALGGPQAAGMMGQPFPQFGGGGGGGVRPPPVPMPQGGNAAGMMGMPWASMGAGGGGGPSVPSVPNLGISAAGGFTAPSPPSWFPTGGGAPLPPPQQGGVG